MHPDEIFASPAQTLAGLSIDIHDSQLLVQQKEGVRRAIDKRAEPLLARAQSLRGTPAPCTELAEEQAQRDEDEESGRMVRRQFERIQRRDEPVQNSRCAD